MKIANIIYSDDLVNHKRVDYVNYINEEKEYKDIDYTLPTLYVGWEFIKKCNPDNSEFQNINILKHEIQKNKLYWEFSFNENKSSHVKGVSSFVKNTPNFYFNGKYEYINLDPVFHQIRDIEELFDILPKNFDGHYCYNNNMCYILSGKKIYGLHIPMYEFFKFNIEKIYSKLNEKSLTEVRDDNGTIYQKYYKIFPEFTYLKRYIVVFLTN